MNILLATGIYPPEIGGPATFAAMLKKALPSVRVVTYTEARIDEMGVIGISRLLPKGVRHIAYFFALARNAWWADIVVALDPVSAGFPARWAARLFGKKFVLRIVGDYAWEQGMQRYHVDALLDEFLTKRWSPPVERLRRTESTVACHAARVIVPSQYLAGVVERWGVEKNKIVIVPNSVSLPVLPERLASRAALGFADECVIVSVGRMVPWKGFGTLIDAVKDLPVILIIIGDGPDRSVLEGRAKGYANIRFAGVLSKDMLVQYLAAADMFALNTGYEGFSHQLIEAMSAGLPIITTGAGGNREIVRDGENALVVTYNDASAWKDAILRLSSDSALRHQLGSGAKAAASRYTQEKTLEAFTSLLNSL